MKNHSVTEGRICTHQSHAGGWLPRSRQKAGGLLPILSIACLLLFTWSSQAQTPVPNPDRETLIQEVQKLAQRDVERSKPQRSTTELLGLFAEKAETVGLSRTQMAEIYDDRPGRPLQMQEVQLDQDRNRLRRDRRYRAIAWRASPQ